MIITPFVISSGVYSLPSLRYANEDRVEKNIETIFRNISREKKIQRRLFLDIAKNFTNKILRKYTMLKVRGKYAERDTNKKIYGKHFLMKYARNYREKISSEKIM